jgi:hypothetical protein
VMPDKLKFCEITKEDLLLPLGRQRCSPAPTR